MEAANCPDCGTETEWCSYLENGELIGPFQALCDGCQADRAVERAYADTNF